MITVETMATSEALDVNLPTEGEATGSRERENIKDNTEATMSGAQNVKGLQESVITILPDNRKSENVVYIAKNESLDLCHGVSLGSTPGKNGINSVNTPHEFLTHSL